MSIRNDFPILQRRHRDNTLAYLDSAATTQKPDVVIDAIGDYYRMHNANVHRAAHVLAAEATQLLEEARGKVADFVQASSPAEIVFTRGTTEAINLVASTIQHVQPLVAGDEILITMLEHHSNIVPWQMLAARTGASLVAANVDPNGDIDLDDFHQKLGNQTKIVALSHVSNALRHCQSRARTGGERQTRRRDHHN